MLVGEAATFRVTAAVACPFPGPAPGSSSVTASITAATSDPAPSNNTATASLSVVNPAPKITGAQAIPLTAWPPNYKMADVGVLYTVTPACGGTPTVQLGITASSGTAADWQVVDLHHVQVRSERSGTEKNGRTYLITITAVDPTGSSSATTVGVTVPHDQGSNNESG